MASTIRCFALHMAFAAAATVSLNVDWPSFLQRSDPVWSWNSTQTAPSVWTQSLFGGNGMLGYYIWADEGMSGLRIDIGRSDLYDDRSATGTPHAYKNNFVYDQPRLPLGSFRLTWAGALTGAVGRVGLWDAQASLTLTTSAGAIQVRVWANAADAQGDVIVMELVPSGGESVQATFVPQSAQSTWQGNDPSYVPNPPWQSLSTPSPQVQGATLNLTSQPHLSGAYHTTAVLSVPQAAAGSTVLYTCVSPVMAAGKGASDAYATDQVNTAASGTVDALRAAHSSWWHQWWPAGGFITLPYSVLESFWWVQQYKFACASRAGRALHDLMGPWFIEGTPWPDLHWDMNLQQTYYLPLASNRPDLSSTLTNFMQAIHESGALAGNVPTAWQADSSGAPTGASSLYGLETCYWNYGPNCTTSPPSITGNLLWACQLLYLNGEYSENRTVHTSVLFPILDRALQAYQHFQIPANTSSDGLTHLPITFSPEYPGPPGPDANYDLALYRWGLVTALDLVQRYNLSSPHVPAWQSTLSTLTWYSIDASSETFSIYQGIPYGTPHRHYSHLFMIWPLRTLDFANETQYDLARNSINRWLATPEEDSQFYRPAASAMNVLLGQLSAAFDNITYLLHTRIEPNTFYREGSQGSCTETPLAAAWAVADWLIQSWNRTAGVPGVTQAQRIFHFFPAIADAIRLDDGQYTGAPAAVANASFYRLATEGGFLASAARSVVSANATHYVTQADFLALEVPDSYTTGVVVVRTSMSRPLVTDPPGLPITPLWEDVVAIGRVTPGMTLLLSSASSPAGGLAVVQPVPGCAADFNAWGYHPNGAASGMEGAPAVAPHLSARLPLVMAAGASATVTPVVLRNCTYMPNGRVTPSQNYLYDNSTGKFALQDGSGRCLTVSSCAAANGDLVTLAPCTTSSSTPIGCEPDCTPAAQAWLVQGASSSPPNAIRSSISGRCLDVNGAFNPDIIDVYDCDNPPGAYKNEEWTWDAGTGAILSMDTDACCLNMCLTPAAA